MSAHDRPAPSSPASPLAPALLVVVALAACMVGVDERVTVLSATVLGLALWVGRSNPTWLLAACGSGMIAALSMVFGS